MIEINLRIKIDTNDPREAYLQARGALAFSGHECEMSDYWLINGKPLPKQVAKTVRQCNGIIAERNLTQCVTPAEHGKSDAMIEFAESHGLPYRLVELVKPTDVRLDHRELMDRNVESMLAINSLMLAHVPRPRCIHNEVDFDVSAEETPMFRAMFTDDDGVDFDTGPAWGNKPGATYIDFDVGTAEEIPLSAIDVEIYDLMNTLVRYRD